MLPAYGLYTHIRANRIRSVSLLASFIGLLLAVMYSLKQAMDPRGIMNPGKIFLN